MNKKTKIISSVTAAAVATSALAWSAFASDPIVYEPKEGAILGVATHFHLFANEITLHSHVHGNVATNMLEATRDFGVRPHNLDGLSSINYIRDFTSEPLNGDTLSTKLVIGNDIEVSDYDNGNGYTLLTPSGGHASLHKSKIGELVVEDKNTPYIDISKELDNFAKMSEKIAEQSNSKGIDGKLDMNHSSIDCSGSEGGFLYYTIDLKNDNDYYSFASSSQLHIKGVDFDEKDFLYVTIDVGDRENVDFNKAWFVYDNNGESYKTGEISLSNGGGRIVYNIVSNGKPFTGTVSLQESKLGSILAPKASVVVKNNTCGTIIADRITCDGESHRWDVQVEGSYDKNDRNPLFDPEDDKPVVTTTTATTTEATTPAATTTTTADTTTTTTTTKAPTPATTTTTTTAEATTTTTTTKAPTPATATTTTTAEATTTTTTTKAPTPATTTTTTTAEATTTTTTTKATTPATTTTTTTAETTTTTTTTKVTTPETTTTTTAETTTTTTAPVVSGDASDEATTTTTAPVVSGDESDEATTTTTAPAVSGDASDEATTTTTAPVVSGDESDEATTTTTAPAVSGDESDETPDVPTIDEIRDFVDKLPEKITSDEQAEEIDRMISTITDLIETGTLTSDETDELEELRKVLSDKYEKYTDSVSDTGFGAGSVIAVIAGTVLVLAGVIGRKKLEEE